MAASNFTSELFFDCRCPSCKRFNDLPVSLLGHEVTCRLCNAVWRSYDADNESAALLDPIQYWVRFTEHGESIGAVESWLPDSNSSPNPR